MHQRAPEKHKAAKPPREERALAQDGSALRAVGLALGEGLNSLLKHDLHAVYKSHKQSLMDFRELNATVYPTPIKQLECSPCPGTLRNGGSGRPHRRGRCGRAFLSPTSASPSEPLQPSHSSLGREGAPTTGAQALLGKSEHRQNTLTPRKVLLQMAQGLPRPPQWEEDSPWPTGQQVPCQHEQFQCRPAPFLSSQGRLWSLER